MNCVPKSLSIDLKFPRVCSFAGGVCVMSDEFYPSFPIESAFFFFLSVPVLLSDSQMS